jgi:mono/diheme cytochrome c family protein
MVRCCTIPFSHQEDRYMLRNSLLVVSVLFATAACGQSQTPPAAAPAPAATTAAAPAPAPATAAAPAPAPAGGKLYTVVEGYKVDAETMKGFRTWRAAACDRCHGANQEGLVGPSLVNSLKTLTKEEFVKTVTNGRLEKGMQSFGTSPQVMENMNQLYAYLKGRSDGAITRAKVEPMP